MRIKLAVSLLFRMLLQPALADADAARSIEERVTSCEAAVATQAADEMLRDSSRWQEPLAMFLAADALQRNGRQDDAVFWYYAADLRSQYQAVFERGDRGQAAIALRKAVTPAITVHGYSDTAKLGRTLTRVLEWDRKTPNRLRDRAHTTDEKQLTAAVYAAFRSQQRQLATRGPALEQQARAQAAQIGGRDVSHCKSGKTDPLLSAMARVHESRRVEEFVRRDPAVIRAAGAIESTAAIASVGSDDSHRPRRYTIKVRGNHAAFADVDVARSGPSATLTVRCIAPRYSVDGCG